MARVHRGVRGTHGDEEWVAEGRKTDVVRVANSLDVVATGNAGDVKKRVGRVKVEITRAVFAIFAVSAVSAVARVGWVGVHELKLS